MTTAQISAIEAADTLVLTQAQINSMSQEQWNAISDSNRTAITAADRRIAPQ
jgi:allophanate hydrolase subunit 2